MVVLGIGSLSETAGVDEGKLGAVEQEGVKRLKRKATPRKNGVMRAAAGQSLVRAEENAVSAQASSRSRAAAEAAAEEELVATKQEVEALSLSYSLFSSPERFITFSLSA